MEKSFRHNLFHRMPVAQRHSPPAGFGQDIGSSRAQRELEQAYLQESIV
ncbi:MAG: hypothetical protein WBA10_05135 [Elainellaceae cyanobacterium]